MVENVIERSGITVDTYRASFATVVEGLALPHSGLTILFELTSTSSSVAGRTLDTLCVGMQNEPLVFTQRGDVDCVEMRLSPSAAYRAGIRPADLVGRIEGAEQVLGPTAAELGERLAGTLVAERPAMLRRAVAQRSGARVRDDVEASLRMLEQADPARAVGDLAGELGGSRSALWRRTTSALGMSPKHYLSLRRFERVSELLSDGEAIATAAARSGYVDQSHLHRHVKRFSGRTPRGLQSSPGATYVQDGDGNRWQ